jgi:tetratricopeptide (TPR) repeat protein
MGWLDRLLGRGSKKDEGGKGGVSYGGPGPAHGRGPTEEEDARLVDEAVRHLQEKRFDQARKELLGVVGRTPADYVPSFEADDRLYIKFWDLTSFVAYVAWMKSIGQDRHLVWLTNAYPRACYYLGYIQIEAGDLPGAVRYLDQGLKLEPTNTRLKCEKGQALIRLEKRDEAMAVYQEVLETEGFLSPDDRALALRGKGYVLIELEHLEEAEQAFQASLEIEPDNTVAKNELAYIAQQRQQQGLGRALAELKRIPGAGSAREAGAAAELGISQEQFDIWYQSYQFALQMSGKASHWNEDIDDLAREVGALTEAQIAAGRTDFHQAVLNRIRMRATMERRKA